MVDFDITLLQRTIHPYTLQLLICFVQSRVRKDSNPRFVLSGRMSMYKKHLLELFAPVLLRLGGITSSSSDDEKGQPSASVRGGISQRLYRSTSLQPLQSRRGIRNF